MARGANQKKKLLLLLQILWQRTDEEHPLSMQELLSALEEEGVPAERKSVYDDFLALEELGFEVLHTSRGYYLLNPLFELPELKLLVDAVQASRFITSRKSKELIRKLEALTSRGQARQLDRQVYVGNRSKADNEAIYYIVDALHAAITCNRQVRFRYFEWTAEKTRRLRRNGDYYTVSPWSLTWSNENYYLIAYDPTVQAIRHFRVDRMLQLETVETPRDGQEIFRNFDMALYSKQLFGMFGGESCYVTLVGKESVAGAVIDQFGEDVLLRPDPFGFRVTVHVVPSPLFYSWVLSFADALRLAGPAEVLQGMRDFLAQVQPAYNENSGNA